MAETRERVIGSTRFRLTLFGAKEGQRVLLRLTKILGPAVASLVGAAALPALRSGKLETILDLDLDLGQAVRQVFDVATEADLDYLNDAFSKQTDILLGAQSNAGPQTIAIKLSDGSKFEDVFSRHYGEWLQWLAWAISENFADFFAFKGSAKPEPPGGDQSQSGSRPA